MAADSSREATENLKGTNIKERTTQSAQLFQGEDGSSHLRLWDGSGNVRVKLGATPTGAGLILFDQDVEKGKEQRIIKL